MPSLFTYIIMLKLVLRENTMEQPIVIFEDIPIEGRVRDYFQELFERTTVLSPNNNPPEEIENAKQHAIAWISRIKQLDLSELSKSSNLKLISAWGVGYNHIDVAAATAKGIPVCINPVFSHSMAEAALLFILALSKRLPQLMQDAIVGRSTKQTERGVEIRGKTVGLVGFGRIGRETGELCKRMETEVTAYDPYLSPSEVPTWCQLLSLGQLLHTADFVVITAPLTSDTYHLMGSQQFKQMKPSGYLINIARGPLVDEKALIAALDAGQIAGAGLDVWEIEPVKIDNPLLHRDNVITTPHKIGATWESLEQVCRAIQTNVFLVLENKPPFDIINPEIYRTAE
jgi:D-3-phosphoglycerate dehydrogenase